MRNSYEFIKAKKSLKYIILITAMSQVIALIFFTMVGRFESTEAETILTNSRGIMTLSSTLTFSVLTVYIVYIMNKNLLLRYIGNFRERTYIYPIGRDVMFINKLKALVYRYMYVYILELCLINLVYVFAVKNIGIVVNSLIVIEDFLSIISMVIMSALVSLAVLLLSIVSGLKFQSANASLVTSIILITIVGNAVAVSYLLLNSIILLISIGMIFIDYISIKYLLSRIKNDDVME
ncbi:MAG: hypothetical protein ACTTKD_09440 [Peptoanaerobacter stomatis]|uniref:hypothetical protein n=1 Tax=Peptoanaerobacter stomatis TaxID=796937 RepID=UPI003FA13378